MVLGRRSPGPAIGAGGYLGAAGRTWLQMHFANAGAYILALSAVAAGLLLCTDYVLGAACLASRRPGRSS